MLTMSSLTCATYNPSYFSQLHFKIQLNFNINQTSLEILQKFISQLQGRKYKHLNTIM